MEEDSGNLSFEDDCVSYDSKTYGTWRIKASSIRLIAEFTNQSGPYMDDHFFVFFRREDDGWFEASYNAEGRDRVLTALRGRFTGMVQSGLSNSADFKSRVLWPAEHADKPLFDFRPLSRGRRWHDRLLDQLFPPFVVTTTLKPEFKAEPAGSAETPSVPRP